MKNYTFIHKDSSVIITLSAENEENAKGQLYDFLSSSSPEDRFYMEEEEEFFNDNN